MSRILEAVWIKDDIEVYWVSPVVIVNCDYDIDDSVSNIYVFNGECWYSSRDICEDVNDFQLRLVEEY